MQTLRLATATLRTKTNRLVSCINASLIGEMRIIMTLPTVTHLRYNRHVQLQNIPYLLEGTVEAFKAGLVTRTG